MKLTKIKSNKPVPGNQDYELVLTNGQQDNFEVNVEKDADIKLVSIIHATGKDSYKIRYKISHSYPNTFSSSVFKVVLEDQSRYDFEGMIDIKNGSANSNAYLKVDVLILSSEAKARVVPSLEIAENEIKASHGATITKISEEQMFYMKSRGINYEEAKKLIVEGFLKV